MILYHGTSKIYLNDLITGKIDATKGGGEFGQGFYTGNKVHLVSAWAWHKSKQSKQEMDVISYNVDDNTMIDLRIKMLTSYQATSARKRIRKENRTRSLAFKNSDLVIGPVVGRPFANYLQFVFVGTQGQNFINNQKAEQLWKK